MTRFQILRGTSAERIAVVFRQGELVQDTSTNFLYIGDGVTPGGILAAPLAAVSERIAVTVKNNTGGTLSKGTPVYITGSDSGIATVAAARADDEAKSNVAFVLDCDVSDGSTGLAVIAGNIATVDMGSFTEGSSVYLGPTGGLVQTAPVEPNFIVHVGNVIKNGASGELQVQLMHPIQFANLPGNHVPIGQTAGNTTSVDIDTKISANTSVLAAQDAADDAQTAADDAQADIDFHAGLTNNPHAVTKAQVGLGNVDNTSDADKPVSTAQQAALNLKADKATTISAGSGLTGGGDLSANRTVSMPNVGTAGTYGSASSVPVITTDAQGRVSSAVNTAISILSAAVTDFAVTVRSTVLTGLSLASSAAIDATDTVLSALGKLQAQVSLRALSARQIINGYGITGGGDLTADRTLAVSLSATEDKNSSAFSTGSTTDVLITGLSRTPAAGTYLVLVNTDGDFDTNNRVSTVSIYSGGAQVSSTERARSHYDQTQQQGLSTQGIVTVNGSQAVEAHVRVSGGNITITNKSMILLRTS